MINQLGYESINAVAGRWAETIWAVSWQFCVLGVVVLAVHWTLLRAAPNWRYWLWQILAIKLLLMPFWTATAPWKWPSPSSATELITASPQADSVDIAKSPSPVEAVKSEHRPLAFTTNQIVPKEVPTKSSQRAKIQGTDQKTASSAATETNRDSAPARPRAPKRIEPKRTIAGKSEPSDSLVLGSTAARQQTDDLRNSDQSRSLVVNQEASNASAPILTTPVEPQKTPGLSWQAWLMLAWMGGVVWSASRIIWQGTALSRRLRDTGSADQALIQRVREAAERLGMSRVPTVSMIDLDVSPFVCGLWRTRLILPRGLTESFTSEQLDLVLLHELAHVRRRDLVWGWIPEAAKVFFFFHPLVHFLCYQIRFERELACDQLAMTSSGRDVATYADTLVRVVGQFSCPDSFRMSAAENPQA